VPIGDGDREHELERYDFLELDNVGGVG